MTGLDPSKTNWAAGRLGIKGSGAKISTPDGGIRALSPKLAVSQFTRGDGGDRTLGTSKREIRTELTRPVLLNGSKSIRTRRISSGL